MPRIVVTLFVLMLAAVGASPAWAQPNSRAAVTDPALADADFVLQGEYVGWIDSRFDGSGPVGLQVIALGGGKFDGVAYRGGLPGAGWDGVSKRRLSGQVMGDSIVLLAPEANFLVTPEVAISLDATGRLTKVHRQSPTMGLAPPPDAVVLFDGSSTEAFSGGKLTPDGYLAAGALTKMPVDAFRLHLEFQTPYMPGARGQARGNSGVYIQQRYEVQILDSFGLEGIENECGSLYRQQRPELNMCLPPLAWQTFDIWFTPPTFAEDGKTKTANARITVLHNGVPIHLHRDVISKTGGGKVEGPEPFPINLQDHGNPVAFRNIWIVPGIGDEAFGRPGSTTQFVTAEEAALVSPPGCQVRLRWRGR
jgi:hypothetical protein